MKKAGESERKSEKGEGYENEEVVEEVVEKEVEEEEER